MQTHSDPLHHRIGFQQRDGYPDIIFPLPLQAARVAHNAMGPTQTGREGGDPQEQGTEAMRGQLNRRQASMITIACTIGTGLFLRSGEALTRGGPLGLLMGYAFVGSVCYCLFVSISEMVSFYPGFDPVQMCSKFVDPALGAAMGWNGWYHWGTVVSGQVFAAVSLVHWTGWAPTGIPLDHWAPRTSLAALWPALFLVISLIPNLFGARWHGNLVTFFTAIKVSIIVVFVLIGITISVWNFSSHPDWCQDWQQGEYTRPVASCPSRLHFLFWQNPGSLAVHPVLKPQHPRESNNNSLGQFLAWFSVSINASFSYMGLDIPFIIGPEIRDAAYAVPRLSRRSWWRLSTLYMLSVFVGGLIAPFDDATIIRHIANLNKAEGSLYVHALQNYTTPFHSEGLVKAFITVFIMSALSASSIELFMASRYLYYLARDGHAPKIFGTLFSLNRNPESARRDAHPLAGLVITFIISFITYLGFKPLPPDATDAAIPSTTKALQYLTSVTTSSGLICWLGLLYTYITFYHATQQASVKARFPTEITFINKHRHTWQPFLAYYAITAVSIILVFSGWNVFSGSASAWIIYYDEFAHSELSAKFRQKPDQVAGLLTAYLPISMFILLLFGSKLIKQHRMVEFKRMNFAEGFTMAGYTQVENGERERKPKSRLGRLWWWLAC